MTAPPSRPPRATCSTSVSARKDAAGRERGGRAGGQVAARARAARQRCASRVPCGRRGSSERGALVCAGCSNFIFDSFLVVVRGSRAGERALVSASSVSSLSVSRSRLPPTTGSGSTSWHVLALALALGGCARNPTESGRGADSLLCRFSSWPNSSLVRPEAAWTRARNGMGSAAWAPVRTGARAPERHTPATVRAVEEGRAADVFAVDLVHAHAFALNLQQLWHVRGLRACAADRDPR